MKLINVAKNAGFCFGVKMAVDKALDESAKGDNVVMLGDIVHNEHVVKKIDEAGVDVQNELTPDTKGTLLLRAHGTVPGIYDRARELNLNIVDATCPLVLEIHEIVRNMAEEGYTVIVIGDYGHDEVVAIAAQVDGMVIAKPEDVDEKIPMRLKKVGIVVQSTQNIDNARAIVSRLIGKVGELKFVDTICGPTKKYQAEIRTMPLENDVMIIVGSYTSANTCRLTEISRGMNPDSYQVEDPDDVRQEWFDGKRTVGVTAGASTPDWIIHEVVDRIAEYAR
ncbi:4-hydroxy-3-methylbut-2-enyl diphosphate reductase [candidate division KSB1 bacterium]